MASDKPGALQHVEIDSEAGSGTTVVLYLPAVPANVHEEHTVEREVTDPDIAPTILLVEDDHDVRAYVAEILREHYRVLETHDADSALSMIDRNDVRVDLLLADLVLPGMNGRQLAEQVRSRQPQVRVLFMTGYSRDTIGQQWPADAGIEMLHKPLTQDELERSVRAVLNQPR